MLCATQIQVSQYLAVRKKQTEKSLKMAYPWKSLPSPLDIMDVGPSYATNFQSGLKQSFSTRGLSPATDNIALVSFLIPAEAGIPISPSRRDSKKFAPQITLAP